MQDNTLLPGSVLALSAAAAQRLVEAGNGDAALLYLQLLRSGQQDIWSAARSALKWDIPQLKGALETLVKLGLLQEAAAMLQRTYTCYASNLPAAGALTFSDKNSVADWAASSVSLLAQWGVMQGKEQNTFDPLGTYTREQCIVTFMRLYDRAPEGRAKGTVGTLYSYDEQIQRLTRLGTYGSSILYRADAPTCTVLYVGYLGGVQTYTAFRILYKDGTYRTVDLVKGYASGFYLNAAQTAVNFVNVTGGSMSLDLATGEISQGFK